jgi:alpha-tubulin suppressor-like RCC1 family protein
VYAFGLNSEGQLGLCTNEYESFHIPKLLGYFSEKVVSWISAGSSHSGALTVEGYAYFWGSNSKG